MPDLLQVARDCEAFGADGITVHPRPDERHITYEDVRQLKPLVKGEFNVEGYPSRPFLDLVIAVKPDQVTLVPDPPEALTSTNGWDTRQYRDLLAEVIHKLHEQDIRVSIFLNPEVPMADAAPETGADRVELYTADYVTEYPTDPEAAIGPYVETAKVAGSKGLGINAGHDLNLTNLAYLHHNLPGLLEVSIGQALISDALYYGLENTIQQYQRQLNPG
jgi:pyridoxine 5-phosphate synthase